MGEIIAITNQKGGVAKTTTTYNLSAGLAISEKKVLMVDLDSQASLTISAGIEPMEIMDNCIVNVLTDDHRKKDVKECIHKLTGTSIDNLYILPSIIDLATIESQMYTRMQRELILGKALEEIVDDYDYVLIDCPPQLSILTLNALSCADGVLVPVKTDYLAYRGLENLFDTVDEVRENINKDLKVYGVIATLFDKTTNNDTAILLKLDKHYDLISIINKKVLASKGVYAGISVVELAPENEISIAYIDIVDMIISGNYERKETLPNG